MVAKCEFHRGASAPTVPCMKSVGAMCVILTVAGCGFSREQNDNNGVNQALTLSRAGGPLAAHNPVTVGIQRLEVGTYHCVDHPGSPSFGSLPGTGPWTECAYAGKPAPIEAIVDAHCDDGACTTRVIDAGHVELTSTVRSGAVTLHVSARLTSGLLVSDEWVLDFVAVDSIDVRCVEWAECPGPNAIFAGTKLTLRVVPLSAQGAVVAQLKYAVEPADLLELTPSETMPSTVDAALRFFTVRALKPGLATLRFTSAGLDVTQPFRIVSTDDAVRGRVWHIAKDTDLFATSNNPLGEPLGETLDVKRFKNTSGQLVELMVGWELRDGTVALGGAKGVKSNVADFVRPAGHRSDDQPQLARFLVDPFVVPAGQRVTLSAQADLAVLSQSFGVQITDVP